MGEAVVSVSAGQFVVIGEALIDIVHKGETVAEHVGGSPANVALGLGRLGLPVALLTYVARDRYGDSIVSHLEKSGVSVLPQSFAADRTSTAVARIADDGHADYVFDVEWAVSAEPLSSPPALLHTGSIAAFLPPGSDAVLQHLRAHSDIEITFDPNIREALVGDRAEALERFEAVARSVTLVKMSDEDAAWLYPGAGEREVVGRVLELGPRVVAITRGADGAVLATAEHMVQVASQPTSVVDTIGAGDTFMASLIASISTTGTSGLGPDDLEEIGSAAVHAAAITVSRAGADLPWRSEL